MRCFDNNYSSHFTSIHELIRRSWIDSNKQFFSLWDTASKELPDSFFSQVNSFAETLNSRSHKNQFDILLKPELTRCLESLKINGFYKFDCTLPERLVLSLNDSISSSDLVPELSGQSKSSISLPRSQCISSENSLRFYYSKHKLATSKPLAEFVNSHFINLLASSYFSCRPFTVGSTGWLSKGKANASYAEICSAAQEFHFDVDAFKFLKIFIYLSDVDSSSGAHQFYKSSHLAFPSTFPPLTTIPTYFRLLGVDYEYLISH